MTLNEIQQFAMTLSPEDREVLAVSLLHSLDDDAVARVRPATVARWDRRFEELESGQVQGISADEVTDQVRRELGWK